MRLIFSFLGLILIIALLRTWIRPDERNSPKTLFVGPHSTITNLPDLSWGLKSLSPDDLAFGEAQVALMLKDRPEMGRYVSKGDALWEFCARAFGGEAIGEHILWDSSLPLGANYTADHWDPEPGTNGRIRIRSLYASGEHKGSALSCEEMWSCAVFEIENIRNHKAFTELFERALRGELSRADYIRENARLEYQALRRTADHFATLWLPLLQRRGASMSPEYWGVQTPETYEAWISLYTDPNSYPWDAYGKYYDAEIVPYLEKTLPRRWSSDIPAPKNLPIR